MIAALALSGFVVVGYGIPSPLSATPGDAARGRAIVVNRQQGTLATDLAGAGTRWSEAQPRLRVVDSRRVNSETVMPAYHRVDDLKRVGTAWQGRTSLDAQQVDDVVALLRTWR